MNRLFLLLALLLGALPPAIVADPSLPEPFVADATTGISRAAFDAIRRSYKRGFPPGELVPSKKYPVRIVFSESDDKGSRLERTYKSVVVAGSATIAAKDVDLIVDDNDPEANKERAKDPNAWVEIRAGRLRVKSGHYECIGRFLADGKKFAIVSGSAEITTMDGPVTFSSGAEAVIDGHTFTYLNGRWAEAAVTE